MDAETLYRQHLTIIGQMAESTCRRNGVSEQDAEDFASDVRLKLYEDDFAVIRKFRGDSKFTTFLNVVIGNLFRDYRIRKWGKWRPSAHARRLGDLAVLLETLVFRDGYSFDAACHVLEQKNDLPVQRSELRRMLAQLPRRSQRRIERDEELDLMPADERTDAPLLEAERDDQLATAEEALRRALGTLDDEDRLIIRLLYYEGLTVADIARGLGVDQKPLYPRIRRLLKTLGELVRGEGIRPDFLEFLNSL